MLPRPLVELKWDKAGESDGSGRLTRVIACMHATFSTPPTVKSLITSLLKLSSAVVLDVCVTCS